MALDDITEGFIELLEEISHDPEEFDDYDIREYIENLPNPAHTLYEFALWAHKELL